MATTQKNYRLGGRLPRNTTVLDTFKNGMYLTDQTVPEGYARIMINYDIDDTGNHIRPRAGYDLLKTFETPNTQSNAEMHVSDYLYIYNELGTEVESLKDVILSFGTSDTPVIGMSNTYIASLDYTVDNTVYRLIDDEWQPTEPDPGAVQDYRYTSSWGLVYDDKTKDNFSLIDIQELGFFKKRNFYNCYSFNERFINENLVRFIDEEPTDPAVSKPIYTVMNNELYAYAAPKGAIKRYINNPERDEELVQPPELSKIQIRHNADNTYKAVINPIDVKEITPLEAASTGFNMLANNPYLFVDKPDAGTVDILGILMYPYESLGESNPDVLLKPKFTGTVGEHLALRVYYEYPQDGDAITYKVEYLDLTNPSDVNESKWNTLLDFADTSLLAGAPLWIDYVPLTASTVIRVTTRLNGDSTTDDVQTLNIYCGATKYDRFETQVFNLNEGKGLITWLGRVGVYGVPGAEDTIFFSDIEDAGYFPYPNNILTFETDIFAVHNYLDNLLVFTVDAVWIVTPGTNIMTSTQKKILENTNITEIDAQLVQVLKQEIFFKMNDQFYVLKPNKYTTDITDLKSYLNSTAIANFTQNFKRTLLALLDKMFPEYLSFTEYDGEKFYRVAELDEWGKVPVAGYDQMQLKLDIKTTNKHTDIYLRNVYSTIINSEVHYVYKMNSVYDPFTSHVYDPDHTEEENIDISVNFFYVHIIYNTITRSWRLYIENAVSSQRGQATTPILYQNKTTGDLYKMINASILKAEEANDQTVLFVLKQNKNTVDDSLFEVRELSTGITRYIGKWEDIKEIREQYPSTEYFISTILTKRYHNHTYLDTGVIPIDSTFTKRYREVQFNLLNLEKSRIPFKTYFQLDGKEWLSATQYNVYHVTDEYEQDYGTVYITPLELNNNILYGNTTLNEGYNTDLNDRQAYWYIDYSSFPISTGVNVRLELLGRGRRASLQLLNTSLHRYELAELVWVYRMMNAR